jgi:O-antigen ligase
VAWFGFLISIVSVVAYYTSPGRVMWLFEAPYPDVWGPFLSRNNFAQVLELTLPPALWLAHTRLPGLRYGSMAAVMLAAGLASASRAGAILLSLETLIALIAFGGPWRRTLLFGVATLSLAAIGGVHTLIGRFFDADPLAYRDAIYGSTVEMVLSRPLQGYGLGTYALVYPRFAETDFGYRIEHAHNDWLEWTAEGGVGFAAIWGWLVINATRRSFKHPWAWGIPAVFLHALADFPMARLGVAAWVFILIGAIERSVLARPNA